MIVRLASCPLKTTYGDFTEILYYDGQKEVAALVMGDIENGENILCRIHSKCLFGHYFNSIECDCREQMAEAQLSIQKNGKGIIILFDQEGKGNGHYALMKSIEFKKQGMKQSDAYVAAGFRPDARDFSAAGKILAELKVVSVVLLSANNDKADAINKYGIVVNSKNSL
jgi:GTP cyclohydrolase II